MLVQVYGLARFSLDFAGFVRVLVDVPSATETRLATFTVIHELRRGSEKRVRQRRRRRGAMSRSRQSAMTGCGGGAGKRTNVEQNSFDGSHVFNGCGCVERRSVEARGELHGAGDGGLEIEDRGDCDSRCGRLEDDEFRDKAGNRCVAMGNAPAVPEGQTYIVYAL